jgi:hypothetical protein
MYVRRQRNYQINMITENHIQRTPCLCVADIPLSKQPILLPGAFSRSEQGKVHYDVNRPKGRSELMQKVHKVDALLFHARHEDKLSLSLLGTQCKHHALEMNKQELQTNGS